MGDKLKVELNGNDKTVQVQQELLHSTFGLPNGGTLMVTPAIDENYWIARVHLFKDQYVLAFPKFSTIGIGFAKESDWNTNLPYTCSAEEICEHIWHNHKYRTITKEQTLEAIKLLQSVSKKLKVKGM
jgi:hypothetical protein